MSYFVRCPPACPPAKLPERPELPESVSAVVGAASFYGRAAAAIGRAGLAKWGIIRPENSSLPQSD